MFNFKVGNRLAQLVPNDLVYLDHHGEPTESPQIITFEHYRLPMRQLAAPELSCWQQRDAVTQAHVPHL